MMLDIYVISSVQFYSASISFSVEHGGRSISNQRGSCPSYVAEEEGKKKKKKEGGVA